MSDADTKVKKTETDEEIIYTLDEDDLENGEPIVKEDATEADILNLRRDYWKIKIRAAEAMEKKITGKVEDV